MATLTNNILGESQFKLEEFIKENKENLDTLDKRFKLIDVECRRFKASYDLRESFIKDAGSQINEKTLDLLSIIMEVGAKKMHTLESIRNQILADFEKTKEALKEVESLLLKIQYNETKENFQRESIATNRSMKEISAVKDEPMSKNTEFIQTIKYNLGVLEHSLSAYEEISKDDR